MTKIPTSKQLKAFWLLTVKQMAYSEIAKALHITKGAVASLIYRIRKNEEFVSRLRTLKKKRYIIQTRWINILNRNFNEKSLDKTVKVW